MSGPDSECGLWDRSRGWRVTGSDVGIKLTHLVRPWNKILLSLIS